MARIEKTFTVKSRGVGLPDYSAPKPVGQVPVGPIHTSTDIGELAARLGSPVTYDRRGNVVFYDDFEEPFLKWRILGYVDAYGRLDSTQVKTGSQSVRLHTGDVADAAITMVKNVPILASKEIGAEVTFSINGDDCDLLIQCSYYEAPTLYWPFIKFNPNLGETGIYEGPDTYKKIADTPVRWEAGDRPVFHTIKVVFDAETGLYRRLLFDHQEFDISNEVIFSSDFAGVPRALIVIRSENRAAVGGDIWINDFILTQNEPLNV